MAIGEKVPVRQIHTSVGTDFAHNNQHENRNIDWCWGHLETILAAFIL